MKQRYLYQKRDLDKGVFISTNKILEGSAILLFIISNILSFIMGEDGYPNLYVHIPFVLIIFVLVGEIASSTNYSDPSWKKNKKGIKYPLISDQLCQEIKSLNFLIECHKKDIRTINYKINESYPMIDDKEKLELEEVKAKLEERVVYLESIPILNLQV